MLAGPWASQRLVAADTSTGGQRLVAVNAAVDDRRRAGVRVWPLAAISNDVGILVAGGLVGLVLVVFALATGRAEVALLGLSAAAHTRRVVWIVDAAKITANLAATAGDAGLVHTFVLRVRRGGRCGGGRGGGRRGGVGIVSGRPCFRLSRCLSLSLSLSHGVWRRASRATARRCVYQRVCAHNPNPKGPKLGRLDVVLGNNVNCGRARSSSACDGWEREQLDKRERGLRVVKLTEKAVDCWWLGCSLRV